MRNCELRKEPYEAPMLASLMTVVEAGFGISTENGAGGGSTGDIGEFPVTSESSAFATGSWDYEDYEG